MSESEKRGGNPDATIQLDALDQVSLEDPGAPGDAAADAPVPSARKTPPPLPPEAQLLSGAPPIPTASHAPPAEPRGAGRILIYGGVFLMLLAGAIGAGVSVGNCARGRLTTSSAASTAPASSNAVAAAAAGSTSPSASASTRTLTLPPIEIR